MSEPRHKETDFADAFEGVFARLQVAVEEACVAAEDWPAQVAAAIQAAFSFAAADPGAARTLTTDAMASGWEGFVRYDRLISHFAEQLRPGRRLRPEGRRLPAITERAMISGLATLIAQRLDTGRHLELLELSPEAIQFVLTPYLGAGEARKVAQGD